MKTMVFLRVNRWQSTPKPALAKQKADKTTFKSVVTKKNPMLVFKEGKKCNDVSSQKKPLSKRALEGMQFLVVNKKTCWVKAVGNCVEAVI